MYRRPANFLLIKWMRRSPNLWWLTTTGNIPLMWKLPTGSQMNTTAPKEQGGIYAPSFTPTGGRASSLQVEQLSSPFSSSCLHFSSLMWCRSQNLLRQWRQPTQPGTYTPLQKISWDFFFLLPSRFFYKNWSSCFCDGRGRFFLLSDLHVDPLYDPRLSEESFCRPPSSRQPTPSQWIILPLLFFLKCQAFA